jgi:Flp pilus assembly protein TadD
MSDQAGSVSPNGSAVPEGDVYDWYIRGRELLDKGNAAAAAQLLTYAVAQEPTMRSLRETLARAQFNSGRFSDAEANFERLVEEDPGDDYARFGLGLARWRRGDLDGAAEQLALATAMKPASSDYSDALRQVRATLKARPRNESA